MKTEGPETAPEPEHRETILLVGGSSDIGLELIRQLAAKKPRVLAHCYHSSSKLAALQEQLPELELHPIQADLGSHSDVDGLVAAVKGHCPAPDQIVHLAAPKLEYCRFKDATWENFQRELDIQLRSIMRILQALLPAMAARKSGRIVFVLSSVTLNVPPGALSAYVTSKYALWGLMRALAAEYSSKNININAVSPSMVETSFLEKLPSRMIEIAAAQNPTQRNATPADVAGAVVFLLSEAARYITGINMPITGGQSF